ncbi:MAG: Monofunctional biosynthetic peptidoglycan transglycosylase [Turneriella sp.]|nr:Monofunctional biosynthetic peptidoglycan transglycosylase [Turneriella sp.]
MVHAFEHACRRCAKNFSPNLDLSKKSILSAACPNCGLAHGYDNREGKLAALLEQKIYQIRKEKERYSEDTSPKPVVPDETNATSVKNTYEAKNIKIFPRVFESFSVKEIIEKTRVFFNRNLQQKRALKFVFSVGVFFFLIGLAAFIWQMVPVSAEEAKDAILVLKARQSDVVLDRYGNKLNNLGVAQSEKIPLSEFKPWQIRVLLYCEDRQFYEHSGVEYRAILRALVKNILRLRYAQGASTITQQLARIILGDREKSIVRKVREARLARGIEAVLTKNAILEMYVNNVYLGHGTYSFASAAKFYYAKPVADLSVNEFVSLVALIPSPERFSPIKNNRILRERMNFLFEQLHDAKILDITPAEWKKGNDTVEEQGNRFTSETAFGEKSRLGLWPVEYSREFLLRRNLLQQENQNSTRIFTTIDSHLQERAEKLVQKHLARARSSFHPRLKSADEKDKKLKDEFRRKVFDSALLLDLGRLDSVASGEPLLQAALVAIKPTTGEILAMVGGENFESNNQLNRTIQMRRQTGSAIKPFIYAKALSMHLINAATLVDDSPYVVGSGSKTWAPENINGNFEGPIPVRTALAKSRNIPAIRVGKLLGRTLTSELFLDFFFQDEESLTERFTYDETVAIGTVSLSPLELARAFSVFANNGFLPNPILITRVENHDRIVDLKKTHHNQLGLKASPKEAILSPAENALMVSLLKSSGKFSGTNLEGIIGKTGTTSDSRDMWFVGGGQEIIVAVWFGFDDMRYSLPGATGSALASKLAADFLRENFVPVRFKMHSSMVRRKICPLTGKLASDSCPYAHSEIFLSGVTPDGECLHGKAIDLEHEFITVMGESQFH